jgi:two-component system, OmpR family, phosphate regulon response regulator OmpR
MTLPSSSSPRSVLDDAPHILIIDDDRRLRELLARFLREQGYRVTSAAHAGEADKACSHLVFDAMILDVMMPGESGIDFARRIRHLRDIPILMLTARSEVEDRIRGLEAGVEDYLSKPFEPRELLLRLATILRRRVPAVEKVEQTDIRFGPFCLPASAGELMCGETVIHLTERERDMLYLLARRIGETVPREALAAGLPHTSERTIDVQITRLRRKIEPDPARPRYLQTVRGIGYRLTGG